MDKIHDFEIKLYPWLDANHGGVLENIRNTGKLSDEDTEELKAAIAEKVADYLATLG